MEDTDKKVKYCNSMLLERVGRYLDLDLRIKLGLTPRRLDPKLISNLETKFPRPTLVYLSSTKTLFNFTLKSVKILKPLTLDYSDDGLVMFNILGKDWTYEVVGEDGSVYIEHMDTPWCTELKIKIVNSKEDEGEDSGGTS
jgi:hypothetical protein